MIPSAKNVLEFLLLVTFVSCSPKPFTYYYPYSKLNPKHIRTQMPKDVDECLHFLDLILTDEAKNHFKKQDSTIAVIEISNGLGDFLINNWFLNYYGRVPGSRFNNEFVTDDSKPADVLKTFVRNGVTDQNAMIRIIFTCYYKKLKDQPHDWRSVADGLKSYWVNPDNMYTKSPVSSAMRRREDSITNLYWMTRIETGDTVSSLLHRVPRLISKSPDSYFLTGIVMNKDIDSSKIEIKLISVEADRKFSKPVVGQIIFDLPQRWHLKKILYFNYKRNNSYF